MADRRTVRALTAAMMRLSAVDEDDDSDASGDEPQHYQAQNASRPLTRCSMHHVIVIDCSGAWRERPRTLPPRCCRAQNMVLAAARTGITCLMRGRCWQCGPG